MKKSTHIPLATSTWDHEEFNAIQKVIDSNIFTMGKHVKDFEEEFARFHNSRYCVMVNSGSSANFLMISALFFTKQHFRLNRGDEVIVPAVSWSTTYSPLYYHGLKLKFVDIDKNTLNIDPKKIQDAISPETKAIFAVNLLGNTCNYNEIKRIANTNNLILIEDNCESLGAEYEGSKSGTFGLMSSCSSFFSHHISTMEGGMILTDDEELYHILLSIRAHGWTRNLPAKNLICEKSLDPFYESFRFILPGYNVRPLEMSGAIGLAQLKKLPSLISSRRSNAKKFKRIFNDCDFIDIQQESGSSSWFGFAMILNEFANFNREQLINLLTRENIETRPIVCGNILKNEMIQYYDCSISGDLQVSDNVHNNGLFIGNHHTDIESGLENLYQLLCRLQG